MYPAVKGYGDYVVESFEDYYARWPAELSKIPKMVVEDWIYRHWSCFSNRWIPLQPHLWKYEIALLTCEEILSIDHVLTWIQELDAEGVEYVTGKPRAQSRLAQFMLTNGTFPLPIIVAQNAGHAIYPQSGNLRMKEPLQLIEGHCRLACLRGMINSNHKNLQAKHQIWLVEIPDIHSK